MAGVVRAREEHVRILDFGGGLGFSYYQVRNALPNPEGLEFHIVDLKETCAEGRKLFSNEKNIYFHTSLDDLDMESIDIVHIGSSLQYVEDWQAQLAALNRLNPEYVLMANIPAGDIDTFATAQNYYGSKIPCWFFSVSDLVEALRNDRYDLVFKSSYFTKVYGVEQPYPLENFEEKHRINYPCMLLFQKLL